MAVVALVADLVLPSGLAGGTPYLLVVLLALAFGARVTTLVTAGLCAAGVVAGLVVHVDLSAPWTMDALLPRGVTLVGLAVAAWIAMRQPRRGAEPGESVSERVLRESERRFRATTELLPDMVFTARSDGSWDFANARFYQYTGLSPGSATGSGWTAAMHPEHREKHAAHWKLWVARRDPFECRWRLRQSDGEYRWFLVRAVPIAAAAAEAVKWLGTLTDVHEMAEAEKGLRVADTRKTEFLALLAHELRNPLTGITYGIYRMAQSCDDAVAFGDALRATERQARRMKRMLEDLFDVQRIERGRLSLHRRRIEIGQVIRAVVDNAEHLIRSANHELSVSVPQEPIWIDADDARLEQIFSNLLHNATKYTPPGGRIGIRVVRAGDEVAVRIRDTGEGIAPERLPRIFDHMAQGEPFGGGREGGLGIGLRLVKLLTERHGGTVSVTSDGPGRGSEFTVRLPVAEPVPEQAARQRGDRRGPGREILLVEDDRDAAENLEKILRGFGHVVHVAHDADAALELCGHRKIDVALIDILLPGSDGHTLALELQERAGGTGLVLIAMSGLGDEADLERSREVGFRHHFVKPIDLDRLRQVLATD